MDFVGQSRLLLSEWRACSSTLNNLPVTSATPVSIPVIRGSAPIPNTTPTAWNIFDYKTVNSPLTPSNSVQLTSIQIIYPPTFNGQVDLEMTFTKSSASSAGGSLMKRKFPLNIIASKTNPAVIGKCFSSGAAVNSEATMCASLGGTYDINTGKCKGLFTIDIQLSPIPDRAHYERLELNNGVLSIIIM